MKKSELKLFLKEEVNKFIKDASIDKLEQIAYSFKNNKVIVNKIKELITIINSYK